MTDQEKRVPHAGGRPTDYKPEYCQRVKDFCAQGYSLTAFAGEIEVARSTIGLWMEVYPEFSIACKIALHKRTAFHERRMNNNDATGPMVTSSRFSLVNANIGSEPSEWRENSTTTVQNPDGSNIMDPIASLMAEINGKTRTI